MEKVTVLYEGKTYQVERGVSVREFLKAPDKPEYQDNPVIGALINGEFKSLHYSLIYRSTTIEAIRLFSPLGKRIYRHSICFLLSYAAACLFPQHHLEIGHSLGDGFYFEFTDSKAAKEEIEALSSFMKETANKALPITREKIPYPEAAEIFSKEAFRHTYQLLDTISDGDITIYTLGKYYDMAYEPLVYNTSALAIWDLRQYEDGMLLRYPQSNQFSAIKPFADNPLLFSVFRKTSSDNKILKCESLGDLNRIILNGKAGELIQLSEAMFNARIFDTAEKIHSRGTVKAVFISGPSSSGKTTFSLKLAQQLRVLGYDPIKISLDDYYFTRELVPVDDEGKKDYEALEALDLSFFRQNLHDLIENGKTLLPSFSFKENKRYMREEETVMYPSSILIIEGIHGLNPALTPELDPSLCFKIYISALTSMIIDDHNRISTTDNRMLRRLVRDNRTRAIPTEDTLSMWPSVERGEKNHIFPYQNNADVMINSAMPYELSALAPQAMNLLRSVKPESGYAFATARRLLKFLELICTIPATEIPADSITREFLGGSIYESV